jgi:chromosome segregation ATPase
MVSIEQVRLLEKKVSNAIDYVNRVTDENAQLKTRMDGYVRRIDELEVFIKRFKEDQGRIEETVVSVLDKLNRFEDSVDGADGAAPQASLPRASVQHAPAIAAKAQAPAVEAVSNDDADDDDILDDGDFDLPGEGDDELETDDAESTDLDIF